MAYPGGEYSQAHIEELKKLDVLYARTASQSNNFDIPDNLLAWNPTCHYASDKLGELTKSFLDNDNKLKLFNIYGHSYELENPVLKYNWETFEIWCQKISNKPDIWYATNGEIAEYLEAYQKIFITENSVENRSDTNICLLINSKPVKLLANECYVL